MAEFSDFPYPYCHYGGGVIAYSLRAIGLLSVESGNNLFNRSDVFHSNESLVEAIKEIGQAIGVKT